MSGKRTRVLIATTNRGKLREFRALLADLPIDLVTLDDVLPGRPPVEETGDTFRENALIKAHAAASATGMITLAEDSGLEVDALSGKPGVRSARFASEHATDADNNAELLAALEHVPDDRRTARYRCVLVLLDPSSSASPLVTEGTCEGWIGRAPRGEGGFGYDPLFFMRDASGQTMAEVSEGEKNRVSHRANAVQAMRPHLAALLC
jgi:XTP/dITP diphosphohydrolase